jgi:hypothetical protein
MRINAIVFILVSMSVVSLAAQSAPRYEAAAAYQFMRDQDIAKNDPDLSANFPAGWMASGGVRLWESLEAVGEVSGSSKRLDIPGDKPKLRVYTFMGGPRFRRPVHARINPFAQILFGSARASTSVLSTRETVTDFSYQPGGGIDLNSKGRFGVRLEGDYRIVRAEGHNSKEPRIVGAAVVGF